MKIFHSTYEILIITLFRFAPLSRLWAILLILANAASLCFLDTIYGQVALVAVSLSIAIMVAIHMQIGFVRLLGVGHVLWLGMIPWMISRLSTVDQESHLYLWLVMLIVLNSISLVIDTLDAVRYLRGERQPHYRL